MYSSEDKNILTMTYFKLSLISLKASWVNSFVTNEINIFS